MVKNSDPWSKKIWYLEILIIFVLSWTIPMFGAITFVLMLFSLVVIGITWIYLKRSGVKLIKPIQNSSPHMAQQLLNNSTDVNYDEEQYHNLRNVLNVPVSSKSLNSQQISDQSVYKTRIKFVTIKGIQYQVRGNALKLSRKNINDLSEIQGLDKLWYLKKLDLSFNQLTSMKGIEHLLNLEVLKLNNNKIEKLEDIQNLTRLKKITLNDNQLKEFTAANLPSNLIHINISRNPIIKFHIYTKAVYRAIQFGPKNWFPKEEINRLKRQIRHISSYKSYESQSGFVKFLLIFIVWAGITFGIALIINLIIWGAITNLHSMMHDPIQLDFWKLIFTSDWSIVLFFGAGLLTLIGMVVLYYELK